MTDMQEALKPIKYFLFLIPIAMGAGYYAGNEIAVSEVAMHKAEKLEVNTAQGTVVRVLQNVPPNTVIDSAMLQEQKAFSNRIEPDLVNSGDLVVGKRTKFGLNKGQLVVVDDLAK
ncbi:SAF domain-containing protein [bacterium]|nr:SAF domain-containing protein [bacterium]MBP9808160.1 SAF domain-containing protein [bacterium]